MDYLDDFLKKSTSRIFKLFGFACLGYSSSWNSEGKCCVAFKQQVSSSHTDCIMKELDIIG